MTLTLGRNGVKGREGREKEMLEDCLTDSLMWRAVVFLSCQ